MKHPEDLSNSKWQIFYRTPHTGKVVVYCEDKKTQIKGFKRRRKEFSNAYGDYGKIRIGDTAEEIDRMLLENDYGIRVELIRIDPENPQIAINS